MDNLIQTIETHTLLPQEVDDLEHDLRNWRPNASNMRDLTQLYATALIYQESGVIEVIHGYMTGITGWYFDELIILEAIYHCTCRKQNRELVNAYDGFVCHTFPPFLDLTVEQIKLLKRPYMGYIDRPYINKYVVQNGKRKEKGCCNLL